MCSRFHPPAVDLHIHSTASDGTVAPEDILVRAAAAGLVAVALTDHDTVEGVRQIYRSPFPAGLTFVSGVEISSAPHPDYPCSGSLHVLGYGIDIDHAGLNRRLERLQHARSHRNPAILQKLQDLGIEIHLQEVLALAGDGQAGRPHIAELLIRKGYAVSQDDAFDRFLGTGKPAYVDKYRLSCTEAIGLIRSAGGIAVLAHPGLIRPLGPWTVDALILALAACGLEGVEVFYPDHSPDQTRELSSITERLGLLATGGTDFHGDLKPGVDLGSGPDGFFVPLRCFQDLEALLSRRKGPPDSG